MKEGRKPPAGHPARLLALYGQSCDWLAGCQYTLQGCHWTFAKITENLCACRLTENENKKRQKVEKDEIGERTGPKITENNGKSASLTLLGETASFICKFYLSEPNNQADASLR